MLNDVNCVYCNHFKRLLLEFFIDTFKILVLLDLQLKTVKKIIKRKVFDFILKTIFLC